jgi:hypothetical protein
VLLAPQFTRSYLIDVGFEEGVGSDLPFLQSFNGAERGVYGTYRWTTDGSRVVVPGLGVRPVVVSFTQLPIPADVQAIGPQEYTVWSGEAMVATLPVLPPGGSVAFMVPAAMIEQGTLELQIRSTTFSPPNDPRLLGTPLSTIRVTAVTAGAMVMPAQAPLWAWIGTLVLAALALGYALGPTERQMLTWLLLSGAVLIAAAALINPPRWAFGAMAALIATALSIPLAVMLRMALPPLARRLAVPLPAQIFGALVAMAVISFALRYGGRLYPNSMHGDIGFHVNRFNEALGGLIFLLSKNRGVDFPYPPGPYLIVAPFTLLGISTATVLQLGAALVDALSAVVIYAITTRVARPAVALLAAGIYVFTAATFMTTWWSFDTHIYTQFAHLLLIAALVFAAEAWQQAEQTLRVAWIWAVGVLTAVVFLGHFGFLINTALLLGMLVVGVWLAAWQRRPWAVALRTPLTLAVVVAGGFAALFFYTAYLPLFLEQAQTAREGGLTAVAGREPARRDMLWRAIWQAGLITHFGLFPIPLALIGMVVLSRRCVAGQLNAASTILALMGGSLIVAITFAVFPFVSGVTNSPRWMLFIAWVIAVGGALGAQALWRRGVAGRISTLAMSAFVLFNTAWIWIGPMLWRIRPPEPS